MISPDRPGVGRSDPKPGRALLDWPADVSSLADALGIERFALLGWSAGGPYALACAFALPDRVKAVALIASAIPADRCGMAGEINRMDRVFTRLSAGHARTERLAFRAMGITAARARPPFAASPCARSTSRRASWF